MTLDLTEPERWALAFLIKRELETNRNFTAPQREPLESAFVKLRPAEMPEPKMPPNRRGVRRR
jgi:hypothetical protein